MPVLRWELVRLARALWPYVLLYGWSVWLLLFFWHSESTVRRNPTVFYDANFLRREPTQRELLQADAWRRQQQASWLIESILWQQLLLMIAVTPAATAGALGHEKERDTLAALFGTQLTGREIVADKLLARLIVLAQPVFLSLPVIAMLNVWAELHPGRIGLALVQLATLTYALAAVAMLVSVWTRRTSDAILGCYATYVLLTLGLFVFLGDVPMPGWLDPFENQGDLLRRETAVKPWRLGVHLTAWFTLGLACQCAAAAGLRPAALRQAEQRSGRWPWAFRRPIGDDPIRWRERHVLGLSPVPHLRMVPTYLALTGTFAFSSVMAYTAIDASVARGLFPSLRARQWQSVVASVRDINPERVSSEVTVMGVILLVLATVIVAVRCVGCVAEEKRRKTWDDLVITPLSLAEIYRGKRRGIRDAALPHLLAYAVPMVAMAALGGTGGVVAATGWLGFAVLVTAGVTVMFTLPPEGDKAGLAARARAREPVA